MEDNRVACDSCDDFLEDGSRVHDIRCGTWDAAADSYADEPRIKRQLCDSCWSERIRRDSPKWSIPFEVHTPDHLWNTLNGSGGQLAANLRSQLVGGNVIFCISDGTVHAAISNRRVVGENTISLTWDVSTRDRSWFDNTVGNVLENDLPDVIRLQPTGKTPLEAVEGINETEGVSEFESQ